MNLREWLLDQGLTAMFENLKINNNFNLLLKLINTISYL